ncbi:hypothetical protein [Paraburkholderia nodosa]|uniref:hypothetical protein n=1 Tax=Paraburkholderia nodosa TaxID=392320 RepID=UPI0012B6A259|nr:hypothetical protein [Paraburkholderia nodosa]
MVCKPLFDCFKRLPASVATSKKSQKKDEHDGGLQRRAHWFGAGATQSRDLRDLIAGDHAIERFTTLAIASA